jgi:uncharacterized protein YbjT (DUF2867 family)
MKVILFGATGMVGQGVLRECLLDKDLEAVLAVGRAPTGQRHPKLREILHRDFGDVTPIEDEFAGSDACFYCLGIASAGMSEEDYRRITYDYTMAAARSMAKLNPDMTFIYVSGAGTDSSERGRSMWARVKGKTENALLELPFRAYMFRPGYIQPMHGATSRTRLYRALYAVTTPLYPIIKRIIPTRVTTTEAIGRAMIEIAEHGAPKHVLESPDINAVSAGPGRSAEPEDGA